MKTDIDSTFCHQNTHTRKTKQTKKLENMTPRSMNLEPMTSGLEVGCSANWTTQGVPQQNLKGHFTQLIKVLYSWLALQIFSWNILHFKKVWLYIGDKYLCACVFVCFEFQRSKHLMWLCKVVKICVLLQPAKWVMGCIN